jgi:antitoxin MazE
LKNVIRTSIPTTHNAPSRLLPWGTSLDLRITKAVAKATGVEEVTITAQPGRIVIESVAIRPTLEAMLARFNLQRHGGEVMAYAPVGKEVR